MDQAQPVEDRQTGGVLDEVGKGRHVAALEQDGAKDIYACCTHGVLSGESIKRINDSCIKEMIISDSIDVGEKELSSKFKILSCANLFGEAIMRISGEKSVSSLFNDLPI